MKRSAWLLAGLVVEAGCGDSAAEAPVLVIDVEDNRFHTDPEDLGRIISKIDAEIHGLFPMEPASKPAVKSAPKAPAKPAAKEAPKKPAAKSAAKKR
jgi:hypothetical protein